MSPDTPDIALRVEINNSNPIELIDLTKSLISLANQFNSYVAEHGERKEDREAKLYIREIKTGSVILDLVEFASKTAIPFVENAHTIIGFTGKIKKIINYFLKKEDEKPALSKGDFNDLSTILNPIAKDNASQLNLSTIINGDVTVQVTINSIEANALQNMFKMEVDKAKAPALEPAKEKVLFYWEQAKRDLSAETGNKGIIESISPKAIKVIFEDDALKEKMLKGEQNPFLLASIVDVKVETIQGLPCVYKILKVHESFIKSD
jgi:hypothetical protein